jgi:hypothetical protein
MIEGNTNYPTKDEEHLRLLVIFHRIMGIMTIIFSSFFILYLYFIKSFFSDPKVFSQIPNAGTINIPPQELFSFFLTIASVMTFLGCTLGILTLISAQFIKYRKNRRFIIVVACINCLSIPVGTALGVFTLIVMMRNSVIRIFENKSYTS